MLAASSPWFAASFFGATGSSFAVIIAVCGMILGGIMGIAGMYFAHQRQRLWHETARLALEKGQPVPPYDLEHGPREAPADLNQHDFRGGLILIAVGVGVFLFLGMVADARVAWLGAVPGLIGVALVLHWVIIKISSRNKPNVPRSSP